MSRRARRAVSYDWRRAPRELLEQLAAESAVYWHTPGPGPKPLSTAVCRALDQVCEAAQRRRSRAEIDAEIANLCRDRATLPRPFDLDEVSRINRRIEELCREPSEESAGENAGAPCAECTRLRGTLTNIYHSTLNYGDDPASTLRNIREASGPGAPAPLLRHRGYVCEPDCESPRCPAKPPRIETPFGPATVELCEAEDA